MWTSAAARRVAGRSAKQRFNTVPDAPPSGRILDAAFFDRETVAVARDLLGKVLVRQVDGRPIWGRLVEVEAYMGPEDLASHSSGGRRSPRNEVMYGPPGHAYVYFTYGMHHCLNFVTRSVGVPQAVLVRALEPGPGVGRCGGPGLVCRALDIDRALNGVPLTPPLLYVIDDGAKQRRVVATPRIGIYNSGDWQERPLRFCWDSPHLSRPLPRKAV
ncbi:MAG TPA: DNA-3-methyladenine glycosylase [Candidatus Acidoferrum sp.]|nr:DNA-3-methyladenine glycosylase [Candidatus Acidoferrum sp.]